MTLAALSRVDVEPRVGAQGYFDMHPSFPTASESVAPQRINAEGNSMADANISLARTPYARRDKNLLSEDRRNVSRRRPEAFGITQEEYTTRCQKALRDHFGYDTAAVKDVVRDLGCSVATARNYLEGKTTPQGIYDARALAVIPAYLTFKADIAGLQLALDPRHQAKLSEFMRYCAAQAEQIFGPKDGAE